MLRDKLHMVPPAVIDLVTGATTEFNQNARNNYLQRLRTTQEYVNEAVVKIDAKRASDKKVPA